MTDFVVLVTT